MSQLNGVVPPNVLYGVPAEVLPQFRSGAVWFGKAAEPASSITNSASLKFDAGGEPASVSLLVIVVVVVNTVISTLGTVWPEAVGIPPVHWTKISPVNAVFFAADQRVIGAAGTCHQYGIILCACRYGDAHEERHESKRVKQSAKICHFLLLEKFWN